MEQEKKIKVYIRTCYKCKKRFPTIYKSHKLKCPACYNREPPKKVKEFLIKQNGNK